MYPMRTMMMPTVALSATVLAGVTLLAGCTGGSSPDHTSGSTTAAPAPAAAAALPEATDRSASTGCSTADLTVTVGASDGAAGSVYRPLEFQNTSDSPCTISGYPGVSLVAGDQGSRQIGAAADREKAPGAAPAITLTPGDVATADLKITNPGVYGDRCTATPADALRIYPPNERDSVVVAVDGLVGCTGDDAPVTLHISRLQKA